MRIFGLRCLGCVVFGGCGVATDAGGCSGYSDSCAGSGGYGEADGGDAEEAGGLAAVGAVQGGECGAGSGWGEDSGWCSMGTRLPMAGDDGLVRGSFFRGSLM